MEFAERFGGNLRRIREGAGLSQEALGLRCSLHRTEIGLLERGERVPRIDTLLKIAGGLGIRVETPLLEGIDWIPARTQTGGFALAPASEQRGDRQGSPPARKANR